MSDAESECATPDVSPVRDGSAKLASRERWANPWNFRRWTWRELLRGFFVSLLTALGLLVVNVGPREFDGMRDYPPHNRSYTVGWPLIFFNAVWREPLPDLPTSGSMKEAFYPAAAWANAIVALLLIAS